MKRNTKFVTYKHLKPGQELHGWKLDSWGVSTRAYVKEANAAYVSVVRWRLDSDDVEKISSSAMFEVEMTREEYERRWQKEAQRTYNALQNKLHIDQIGYHEMDNHWLSTDIYEMVDDVDRMHGKIIGVCNEIDPKISWLTGDFAFDIGICLEYDHGERMWCHFSSEYVNDILETYAEEFGGKHGEV